MYQIRTPSLGCLVFATKWHPKLKNGARIGVCKELFDGMIRVADEQKEFVVITALRGFPFHDFWQEGNAPIKKLPRLVSEVVKTDFEGKNGEFGRAYGVQTESANQWCRGKWVIYENELYSPQHRHDKWVEKQVINEPLITFSDLIFLNYAGNDRLFAKENGPSLVVVQSWIRNNWLIFNGAMYSPQRRIKAL